MKEEKKTSKEILSELFDKFNATPPSSPSFHSADNDNVIIDEIKIKKESKKKKKKDDKDRTKKKKKKEKKSKHKKHKDKKSKKKKKKRHRSRSHDNSSDSDSSDSDKLIKKEAHSDSDDKKKNKSDKKSFSEHLKNMKKEKLHNDEIKDSKESSIKKIVKDNSDLSEQKVDGTICESKVKTETAAGYNVAENTDDKGSVVLPDVVPTTFNEEKNKPSQSHADIPPVADIFVQELLESTSLDKAASVHEKQKANIKILDLKKSYILELAEQKKREDAEKYEEGEITSDSTEEDNIDLPTLRMFDPEEDISLSKSGDDKDLSGKLSSCHSKSSHRLKRSRSGSRGRKHKKKCHKLKRGRSGSRDRQSRSRSRSRKKRRSSSLDKKWDKDDPYRDEEKKLHHRSCHKKRKSERRSSRDIKDDKSVKEKKEKKEIDKNKILKERRSLSRERRRNKSKSPLQLPSMILQDNPKKKRRSRSRSRTRLEIDKKKLLEIARKNALSMLKQQGGTITTVDPAKVAAITAGGKTVDELTDFCKQLSQKEGKDDNVELSPITESSDDEGEKVFHHPFLIKDRPTNIVMNIRNCAALPVKTHQEKTAEAAAQLRLQFPVSSGQHHRKTESEWVPVEPKKDEVAAPKPVKVVNKTPAPPTGETEIKAIEPPPAPPTELVSVFPTTGEALNINIGDVVGQKLAAMKRLQDNPIDYSAMKLLRDAEEKLTRWNEANQLQQPGLFTGSTGARLLTPAELASGQQAWAKKDQLMCAQPVTGGIGSHLLQKMGWKPGEGLGKNHEGTLEPLSLPLKMDKRGLVCAEEVKKPVRFLNNVRNLKKQTVKSLEGKHPVSLLLEFCSKRHFNPPIFNVSYESGPSHKKTFLFKVEVNGVEYQPQAPSNNKKLAKSEAAVVCLRALGLMPSTSAPAIFNQ